MEEFVRRNLGDEVFERLIEPFCSGNLITNDLSQLTIYCILFSLPLLTCAAANVHKEEWCAWGYKHATKFPCHIILIYCLESSKQILKY